MKGLFLQIREAMSPDRGSFTAAHGLSSRFRILVYLIRLGFRIVRQWAKDKCPQQAAALSFQTALSLVPVTAIALTLLRSVASTDAQSRLSDFIGAHVFPDFGDITSRVEGFSQHISVGALGGIGLFVTLTTCYSLFAYVERIVNDIWRVHERRGFVSKFLTFYALLTLLPALASASLYWSGRLTGAAFWAQFLAPLLLEGTALLLFNKLLPYTLVRWKVAAAGALVTSLLLELSKWAFVTFAQRILLDSYSGVYGPLGLIPLLLLWIYASWLIVLFGVELAFAFQNLRLLEAEDRRQRDDEPINGLLAAQILSLVAAALEIGGRGATREAIVAELGVTPNAVDRIMMRLKSRGLVAEVHGDLNGYIPARAAGSISLDEVLRAFRSSDLEIADGHTSLRLRRLVAELDQQRAKRTAGVTIADLMPRAAPSDPSAEPALEDQAVPS